MSVPILQIYGQPFEHCDLYIVGNKEGLLQLENMLRCPKDKAKDFFQSDGEGYSVLIREVESEEEFKEIPCAYDHDFQGIYKEVNDNKRKLGTYLKKHFKEQI